MCMVTYGQEPDPYAVQIAHFRSMALVQANTQLKHTQSTVCMAQVAEGKAKRGSKEKETTVSTYIVVFQCRSG